MTCVYPLLAAALSVSRLTRTVRQRHVTAAEPLAIGTFREGLQITGAGVKRQYLRCVGKVANGITTVHLAYVRERTGMR